MSLAVNQPIGFIPSRNAEASHAFNETVLGLHFESEDPFALVFRLGPAHATMLRIVRAESFTPAPYTIFGWQVHPIESCLDELVARGVVFERFAGLEQGGCGIRHVPDGTKVAWFKDPDGNLLSISEHP